MKKIILSYLFSVLALVSYSQEFETELQSVIDSIYDSNPESVGIMVHVECPEQDLSWSGAIGYSDKNLKTPINPAQPALIASSIKTYVSATVLRLVERGDLSIEDPCKSHLSDTTVSLFEEDGYDMDGIRIKHLLSHTSGIEDYANQDYIDFHDKHKQYRWSRDEQLQLTVKVGDPLGSAGDTFSYADANYLLLTEIIEQKTGRPFYEAMRDLLAFERLGLDNTWFPTLEENPSNTKALVHQYWETYGWDSYNHDVSWDLYGGGGIACTTEDMAKFSYHLFNSDIVKDTTVLSLIFTEIETKDSIPSNYYLGLSEGKFSGMVAYGHGGFWGTVVFYIPDLDTSISIFVLERDKGILRRDIMEELVKTLSKRKK